MVRAFYQTPHMELLFAAVFCFFMPTVSCTKSTSAELSNSVTSIMINYHLSASFTTTVSVLRKTDVKTSILYITTDYGGGHWVYDSSDNTAIDNTGTELVTINNQRLKRIFQGALNIKWFGAIGDSITDETKSINLALVAVHDQKKDLYVPAGIYSCNTIGANKQLLVFNAGNADNISIYGDGPASKITTTIKTASVLFYIYAYSQCKNLMIKNVYLESTHGITADYTDGIFVQGTKGENFSNILISQCKFEGFGTDIGGQGLNGVEISNNIFNAPKGHDNAQNNSRPAVFIWLFDNNNGYCSDVKILNNNANGYSGAAPVNTLATKRPMDGFVYGTGYGYLITGNTTKNFSEEHIAIAPTVTFPNSSKQILISGNLMDCMIPAGSLNQNGTIHSGNYAIRCDAGNATIEKNTINNFTLGIMVRTYDYPLISEGSFVIAGNTLSSTNSQNGLLVNSGIFVQGSLTHRLHNVTIGNNIINVADAKALNSFSGILLYDTDTALVENNQINVNNLISVNNMTSYGMTYGRVKMVTDKNNSTNGITLHNTLLVTDQVYFATP